MLVAILSLFIQCILHNLCLVEKYVNDKTDFGALYSTVLGHNDEVSTGAVGLQRTFHDKGTRLARLHSMCVHAYTHKYIHVHIQKSYTYVV